MNEAKLSGSTRPRLGGFLAAIFWIAVLIVAAVLLVIVVNISQGGLSALAGLGDLYGRALRGTDVRDLALRASLFPLTFMAVWAICTVALTLARSVLGPAIITLTFVLWIASTVIAPRTAFAGPSEIFSELVVMLPQIVTSLIILLAFAGYMFDGERPRTFYRAMRS